MLYVETESMDAAFHFSVEEYFMQNPAAEPVMMLWRTDKCVMLGHNQVAAAEIDLDFAQKENIRITRRASGGGAIFTDPRTFLYTLIMPLPKQPPALQAAKELAALPVTEALNRLGVPAKLEGRNDILVQGKKVSGVAQYTREGLVCTHGSLLYDANLDTLSNVLRPDDAKICSKGLRSVRSRVTNIKEYLAGELTAEQFLPLLRKELLREHKSAHYALSAGELKQIKKIRADKYANPLWILGNTPKYSLHCCKRFPAGKVEVYMNTVKGVIISCEIRGDFLGTVSIRDLEERFENVALDYNTINSILDFDTAPYLGGVTKEEFLSCIFS